MLCSISGEVPEVPVVSTKSGHVFEKSLVAKHIGATGKCPVTEEPLSLDDLVEVKGVNPAIKPRSPSVTSISALLKLFQNEWDTLMLETYKLKQHVSTVREELAHALYQHDAACRVIARLTQERDRARKELADTRANMKAAVGGAGGGDEDDEQMEESAPIAKGITTEVVKEIVALSEKLLKARKKKFKKNAGIKPIPKSTVASYKQISHHTLHSPSQAGILCMSIKSDNEQLLATGGVDNKVILFDRTNNKIVHTFKDHRKKVLSVDWLRGSEAGVSTSADKTINIFGRSEGSGWGLRRKITTHQGAVTGLSIHPLQKYFVTCSDDRTWAFHDIEGNTIERVDPPSEDSRYTVVQHHPDGQILGTGAQDSFVRIWDIKNQANVASFEGHNDGISAMSFSENGYYLATADNAGVVKMWDLRRLQNFHTDDTIGGGKPVRALSFDPTGQYLAIGTAKGIECWVTKEFKSVCSLGDAKKPITALAWGRESDYLAAAGMDRTLRFYAPGQ